MDWRWYIPHALIGGAVVGLVLAAVLLPIQRRREIRRRRAEIHAATERLKAAAPVTGPSEPFVPHKKWPSIRRLWRGYYGSA